MNVYTGMAYFVAEKLHMNPNEILDEWSTPQLIVAYGYYANQIASQNYEDYRQLDASSRSKIKKPKKYIVEFINEEEG